MLAIEERSAVFSPCRTWRYSLTRTWDPALPYLNVIGLNPSTADEQADDNTIRRCIRFARRWGLGGLVMTNLFALRSTDPKGLRLPADPVGPENDRWLDLMAMGAGRIVAAWGNHGGYLGREAAVLRLLEGLPIECFQLTKEGHPAHPLYQRSDIEPTLWTRRADAAGRDG